MRQKHVYEKEMQSDLRPKQQLQWLPGSWQLHTPRSAARGSARRSERSPCSLHSDRHHKHKSLTKCIKYLSKLHWQVVKCWENNLRYLVFNVNNALICLHKWSGKSGNSFYILFLDHKVLVNGGKMHSAQLTKVKKKRKKPGTDRKVQMIPIQSIV